MSTSNQDNSAAARAPAVRWFGRLQLLRLLGKSERTMAWRVADPRSGQELMLVMPRVQPVDAAAMERWQQAVRQASRLDHPHLAAVVESGVQDGWPFVAYDPRDAATLAERLPARGVPAQEAAEWTAQMLQGLAYAHEAGLAHHDVQPYMMFVSDGGQLRVAGLSVAAEMAHLAGDVAGSLRVQRAAAERDVLAIGVLLHRLLTGQPTLEEPDIGRAIARLPPLGREIARLPWSTAQPVPEPLRAIANRTTDRQERQRYRGARTLLRALEGWLQSESSAGGGPLALLSDRLRGAGVLPASPGGAERAARLAMMERGHTTDLADVVLDDLALSFELLRLVNSAQVRGAQISGSGPVLTVRRAIAMMGLEGVRRAALGLRAWPGPLNETGAADLERLIDRCKRAGRVAVALRPAGYDAEVIYLIALMQNLGRLVVHYHFADEAAQIRRLMQPAPPPRPEEPEEPGMTEEGAAFAVLGVDIEGIGAAVARHWGLDDSVLTMVRRQPLATAPRTADGDDDLLRAAASCANEAVDALAQPAPRVAAALARVVARYGRLLNFGPRELQEALQAKAGSPLAAAQTVQAAMTAPMPLEPEPAAGAARLRT
ncbi:MAG: HDOD domain-containing protein [Hylemonella sp.]|nr:HDOD domain-containing protein [Hylemonella sp.]